MRSIAQRVVGEAHIPQQEMRTSVTRIMFFESREQIHATSVYILTIEWLISQW